MPRSAASEAALTTLTGSSTRPLEHAGQHGRGQQAGVEGRELALVGDLERRRAAGERRDELAELARERQEGPQHREGLGADRRDVDGGADDAAGEGRRDLLGHDHARAVLGLLGRGAEVRRHDDAGQAEERALGGRLLREDVDGRAAQVTRRERRDQRLLVDDVAAGRVDEPRAGLHGRERRGADEAARLGRGRQVERDEVARAVEVLRACRPSRPRARGSGPRRRAGRRRRRSSRCPWRARRPSGRCGRSRARRASSR